MKLYASPVALGFVSSRKGQRVGRLMPLCLLCPMKTTPTSIVARFAIVDDIPAIWRLYLKTNFLYPAKLAAMGDGGTQAQVTMHNLLKLNSDIYRIVLATDETYAIRASVSCAQPCAALSCIMHMTGDRCAPAVLLALVEASKTALSSSASWINWTFRVDNTAVSRLLTYSASHLDGPVEIAVYDYYSTNGACLRGYGSSEVRPATESDRAAVLDALKSDAAEWSALASAGPLENENFGEPAQELQKAGLQRQRQAFALEKEGQIALLAVADHAPLFWNLSNLFSGVRFWATRSDLTPSEFSSMITTVSHWFGEQRVENWTILANPAQSALASALCEAGSVSHRQYQRVTVPRVVAPGLLRECVRLFRDPSIQPQFKEQLLQEI